MLQHAKSIMGILSSEKKCYGKYMIIPIIRILTVLLYIYMVCHESHQYTPSRVSIYTSTMDPSWHMPVSPSVATSGGSWWIHRDPHGSVATAARVPVPQREATGWVEFEPLKWLKNVHNTSHESVNFCSIAPKTICGRVRSLNWHSIPSRWLPAIFILRWHSHWKISGLHPELS